MRSESADPQHMGADHILSLLHRLRLDLVAEALSAATGTVNLAAVISHDLACNLFQFFYSSLPGSRALLLRFALR